MSRILEAEARITAKDATGGVFAQIAGKLKGLEGVSKGVNDRMTASMSGLATRLAAIAGPAALGALATKGVVQFADFERRMSRVGLTADVTGAAVRKASEDVKKLAMEAAMPADSVVDALDALVAQGRSLPEAMAFLPSVVKTAQAAGAETKDIATTAGAIGDQMGITADRMQSAFDILVAAGKAGKFELKDMARYLPALAPLAASVGMKGEEGLRRLSAIAQVVRNQTGTAEEAAASLQNIFAKMESEETTKRFAKFGIDLRKEMAKARKEGKDLLTTFVELADKATKGDLSKVPQLFSDMEFARGMRALLSQKGAVDDLAKSLRNVDGSALKDFNHIVGDTKSSIDQAKEAWDQLLQRLGEKLAPAAATTLKTISDALGPPTDISGAPMVDPNGMPPAGIPDPARPGTRSEAVSQERFAASHAEATKWVRDVRSHLQDERNASDSTQMYATNVVDYYRDRANDRGLLTPGQSIAKENDLQRQIEGQRDLIEQQAKRLKLSRPDAVQMVRRRLDGDALTEEMLRLERARNGDATPITKDEIAERYNTLTAPKEIEIKGDVKTEVEVKVTADEGLIATIVRKATEAVGIRAAPSNGPGSVGTSMPEAAAPRRGRGDL